LKAGDLLQVFNSEPLGYISEFPLKQTRSVLDPKFILLQSTKVTAQCSLLAKVPFS